MKPSSLAAFAAGSALTALLVVSLAAAPAPLTVPAAPQDPSAADASFDVAKMMEAMAKYTQTTPAHGQLERFLGDWNVEMTMMGMPGSAKGTTTFRWLIPERFIIGEGSTPMLGREVSTATILGYDSFKLSYVTAMMNSMETSLRYAEGDFTRDGKSLLMYGTLDEYTTGEHDKMVKWAWRFPDADTMVFEVHDLPIGEENTKVVEYRFTRAK